MFTHDEFDQIEHLAKKEIRYERSIMHKHGQMIYHICEQNIEVLESIIEKVSRITTSERLETYTQDEADSLVE